MPQTIMIVANDPNITYLLQRYAEESGFRTVSACQGKDVLDLAHHTHPVLIILDTELPGSAGSHMLHGLRTEADTAQHSRSSSTPVWKGRRRSGRRMRSVTCRKP